MDTITELQTPRLLLRQWKDGDFKPFSEMSMDERVMEYFPSLLNKKESDAIASKCQALISEQGWGFWAVELKENRSFIGFIGLHIPSASLPFSPCVEVGWRLAYPYWGNGYASEGARASLEFGFQKLDLREIVAFTSILNTRSKKVMEKVGMEKAEEFGHPDIPTDHRLYPHILYRIQKENWKINHG